MRHPRVVDTERRRRRPTGVLRTVRPATPRPGGRRAGGQRRPPRSRAQAAWPRLQRVHPRGAGATGRLPRHRAHPLLDDRRQQRPQHPAVRRRDDARAAGPGPQRQHRQHGEPARGVAVAGVRADGVERLRGDDADARRRRRAVVGGPHRAHPAGVEGGVLAGPVVRRPGAGRPRPVGVPAAVRRPPAARRLGRRQRDVRPGNARLRRHLRGRAGRDRHAAGHRDASPPGADPGEPQRPLHVRVRLLLPPRLGVGRAQRAPRPRGARQSSSPASRPSTPTS